MHIFFATYPKYMRRITNYQAIIRRPPIQLSTCNSYKLFNDELILCRLLLDLAHQLQVINFANST